MTTQSKVQAPRKKPVRRRTVACLSLLAVLSVAGCGEREEAPNLLIITLDTTRRDCISIYGGGWAETPFIDSLAAGGIVFENAVCPMPMTRPSHASLFTGRYPRSVGVENNTYPLTDRWPTLAALLEEEGYQTGAVVSTSLFREGSGFSRGFSRFSETSVEERGRTAREAIEFLEAAAADPRPFFLWVHFFEPHFPYTPPPRHTPAGGGEHEGIGVATYGTLALMTEPTGGNITAPMLERVRALYGGEVSYVDEQVGRLAGKVAELGLDENTLLLVVTDHGESFGHRFYFDHDRVLYTSTVAVGAILRWPRVLSPRRIEGPAEMIDLAPTLLDLLGVDRPSSMEGRSLEVHLGEGPLPEKPLFYTLPERVAPEFLEKPGRKKRIEREKVAYRTVLGEDPIDRLPRKPQSAVEFRGWKLIVEDGAPEELYSLSEDPAEERNLLGGRPEKVEELLVLLREWEERHPPVEAEPEEATEETVERLRALGYVE